MNDTIEVRTRKSNELNRAAFDKLLACLDGDRERAAERYEELRRALVAFFEFRGSAHPDEDADETFDRVARRLAEGQQIITPNPVNYFYGVARRVWGERLAKPVTETPLDELAAFIAASAPNPLELLELNETEQRLEIRLACLRECLQRLAAEERALIVAYYQGEGRVKIENRQNLAASLKLTASALRIKACRLRDRLEVCVSRCSKQKVRQ